ncbi:MAG TPA: RibD family protein, partial [Treponemataceae bacterium]|nr:RibD family protein [Treponemataceae bacterium]
TDEGKKNRQALEQAGVTVLQLPEKDGSVDLVELARVLAQRGIDRVLIEAGESLAWSFLESGLVDRMRMYLAPQFLGGREAPGLFRGGVQTLDRRITLEGITLFHCGEDFVLEGKPCLPD